MKRDPDVVVRFGIERAVRVETVTDSAADFQRLLFAIQSDEKIAALVADCAVAHQQNINRRSLEAAVLADLGARLPELAELLRENG